MGFKPATNIPGRVFVPVEAPGTAKRHACPDCFQCQRCGEDRCRVCRGDGLHPQTKPADAKPDGGCAGSSSAGEHLAGRTKK